MLPEKLPARVVLVYVDIPFWTLVNIVWRVTCASVIVGLTFLAIFSVFAIGFVALTSLRTH